MPLCRSRRPIRLSIYVPRLYEAVYRSHRRRAPRRMRLLAGCDSSADDERPLGRLRSQDASAIAAPDTVTAGIAFDVTVTTTGSGCEKRIETDVSISGHLAVIRPYDILEDPNARVCPDIYITHRHAARVTVDAPGRAVVRAVGRRTMNGRPGEIEVEKTIVVVAR